MNVLNEISDEDFVPFLQSLGVETYKKSFEWMLNDQDFAGVLRWLYQNLDHNNALSTREEYRYAEIQKKHQLLSPEDLESSIADLQDEYGDLCLPGDKEAKEDAVRDIHMQKERLAMLERHEDTINDLLRKNELTREDLNLEVTKLHSEHQQCREDESSTANECLQLAKEVETITEDVIDVVADTLDLYSNCCGDKDIARKFFTFGPFDSYRQSQALFRSHFDLYTSKKFTGRQKDNISDEDLRSALVEAKSMEDRLTDAMLSYIESKAELSGEQAKVSLVANYNNVHPSQIPACAMEAQSALELLEQEETILDQQIQDSVKHLVDFRTRLAVETTAQSALAVRDQIHADISHLLDQTHLALALDRVLYHALRHELRTMDELVHFTADLRTYVISENDAVNSRIESMNQICNEQDICEEKLQNSDPLVETLGNILGIPPNNDANVFVKVYNDLHASILELKNNIGEGFKCKEDAIVEFKKSSKPLHNYVYNGCTKQPRSRDTGVAALTHSLQQQMDRVDKRVLEASGMFTAVKNGDKHNLRKLWQWFLTDPAKLMAAIKNVQGKAYL